jgi:hypothetical protein
MGFLPSDMNCFLRFHFDPPPGLIVLVESPEQHSRIYDSNRFETPAPDTELEFLVLRIGNRDNCKGRN